MAKTTYHRLADQISSYTEDQLPTFVKEMRDRVASMTDSSGAPQTHMQRMAQSDRGHQNPGPGKAKKLSGLK
jgi:hypothetical protein